MELWKMTNYEGVEFGGEYLHRRYETFPGTRFTSPTSRHRPRSSRHECKCTSTHTGEIPLRHRGSHSCDFVPRRWLKRWMCVEILSPPLKSQAPAEYVMTLNNIRVNSLVIDENVWLYFDSIKAAFVNQIVPTFHINIYCTGCAVL